MQSQLKVIALLGLFLLAEAAQSEPATLTKQSHVQKTAQQSDAEFSARAFTVPKLMARQPDYTGTRASTPPYTGHRYRNGGHFGDSNSDEALENPN